MIRAISIPEYIQKRNAFVSNQMRRLRINHGYSQNKIAQYLNCSRARIAKIESGEGCYELVEIELIGYMMGIPFDKLIQHVMLPLHGNEVVDVSVNYQI